MLHVGAMGSRDAPKGFVALLQGVLRGISLLYPPAFYTEEGERLWLSHMDDIIGVGQGPYAWILADLASQLVNIFLPMVGLPTAEDKHEAVANLIYMIGWDYHFMVGKPNFITIPEAKREKILELVKKFRESLWIAIKQLQKAQGYFNHLGEVGEVFQLFKIGADLCASILKIMGQKNLEKACKN